MTPQGGWLWITLVTLLTEKGKDMGREKEYRQRLKYQVSCVRRKTLQSQIAVQLQGELGMSLAESRLLSRRMARWQALRLLILYGCGWAAAALRCLCGGQGRRRGQFDQVRGQGRAGSKHDLDPLLVGQAAGQL